MSKERARSKEKSEAEEKHAKLENLENQVDLLKSQLARTLADYDNLQKRVERDAESLDSRITARVLMRILPSIDMFYDIQSNLNDAGLAMGISSIEESLKNEGLEKIEPKKGDDFDEELHEAVDALEDESQAGKIESVSQIGWRFAEGPVIRHAKVIVFK